MHYVILQLAVREPRKNNPCCFVLLHNVPVKKCVTSSGTATLYSSNCMIPVCAGSGRGCDSKGGDHFPRDIGLCQVRRSARRGCCASFCMQGRIAFSCQKRLTCDMVLQYEPGVDLDKVMTLLKDIFHLSIA